ncbi:MAG: N-acetyl-gamma-glutamyl-phosphate reductase [Spirochaetales bacterium]
MKVAVLGTTGYTGMVLLRLLAQHRAVSRIFPGSSSQAGTSLLEMDGGLSPTILEKTEGRDLLLSIEEVAAAKPDVVFAALPHLASASVLSPFFSSSVVIDLSADFRFQNPEVFQAVYKEPHPRPDLLSKAVYGLSEVFTREIEQADLIANPGCYPTATLLPLLPLVRKEWIEGFVVVNALSGISGAGRSAKVNNLFCERAENTNAYAPGTTHRHAAEIRQILEGSGQKVEFFFIPHVVPLKQGMAVTTVVETVRELTDSDLEQVYREAYEGRPFIRLRGRRIPETREVRNSNRCDIGWHIEGKRVILFSVIDNLLKGASGQAVQNMNLRFGLPETSGLSLQGEF